MGVYIHHHAFPSHFQQSRQIQAIAVNVKTSINALVFVYRGSGIGDFMCGHARVQINVQLRSKLCVYVCKG